MLGTLNFLLMHRSKLELDWIDDEDHRRKCKHQAKPHT